MQLKWRFLKEKDAVIIEKLENSESREFSNSFELEGQKFLEPSTHLFSFNNPYGACPKCEGYGDVIGIDAESCRSKHLAFDL